MDTETVFVCNLNKNIGIFWRDQISNGNLDHVLQVFIYVITIEIMFMQVANLDKQFPGFSLSIFDIPSNAVSKYMY